MERLQKYIASSGYTSRRKAEDLIREGRVSVNGQVVTELGTKVKSGDVVLVDVHVAQRRQDLAHPSHRRHRL